MTSGTWIRVIRVMSLNMTQKRCCDTSYKTWCRYKLESMSVGQGDRGIAIYKFCHALLKLIMEDINPKR